MARGEGARWRRPGNVFRAALVLWLLFVVVRAGRVAIAGSGRAGDLLAAAGDALLLVGVMVFSCFLTGMFGWLLAGIWQTRVKEHKLFPGGNQDGVLGAAIGLVVERFL